MPAEGARRARHRAHPDAGQRQPLLVYRHYESEDILLAANFSRHWQRATLGVLPDAWQHGFFHDRLTDRWLHFTAGDLFVPPYGCLWLAPDVRIGVEEEKRRRGESEVGTKE